jgi:pilus assembly protein CpaF
VRPGEANQMICDAVDVLVQIGIRHEVRRGIDISNVVKAIRNGEVAFQPVYQYSEDSLAAGPRWVKSG